MSSIEVRQRPSRKRKLAALSFNLEKRKQIFSTHKNVAACREETILSETEQALRLYISNVKQIPGVVSVERYADSRSTEVGVTVVVDDLFSPVTRSVSRVQKIVYDAFPDIRFDIDIRDAAIRRNG